MFGFGKGSTEKKLMKKYEKLLKEAHALSHSDRAKSDLKQAEANAIMDQIVEIKNGAAK
jgi:hypothetical protein